METLLNTMLERLRAVTVLDPACGSGNFLYMSLRTLLDLEKEVITHPVWADVGLTTPIPDVHPAQMYGIEINPIAHDLATIVVWIGWIQWKINNGYPNYPEPVLKDLGDNIRQMDAILAFDADGNPVEPDWPQADVIVGNPPFLGGSLIRGELGGEYLDKLYALWDYMHGEADIVTYWFEKSRKQLEQDKVKRVGLLATNSVRGGANRQSLTRIKEVGDLFMAWLDRDWILDGAAVRVSMIGFDNGSEKHRRLNGEIVSVINPDLTTQADITIAGRLDANSDLGFMGITPTGRFPLDGDIAATVCVKDFETTS